MFISKTQHVFSYHPIYLIDLCPGGHVFTPNAIRESFNYPGVVPHRSSCYFLVNVHGATRTRITVDAFGFEEDKDGLDFGEGLIVNFTSNTYVTYDDANPLTTGIIETAQFWFNMFTDKNINSAGYRLQFSAGKYELFLPSFGVKLQ